jgi:hypothetical protein
MSSLFTAQIPNVVTQYASRIARIFGNSEIGPEHVLLALNFRGDDVGEESCSIIPESWNDAIQQHFGDRYIQDWHHATISAESDDKLLPFTHHRFPASKLVEILVYERGKCQSALEDAIAIALSLHGDQGIVDLLETISVSVRELAEDFLGSIGKADYLDHGMWLAICLSDLGLGSSEMSLLATQTHQVNRELTEPVAVTRHRSQVLGLVGMINACSVTGHLLPAGSPPPKICMLTALALGFAFYTQFQDELLDPTLKRFCPSEQWQVVLPLLRDLLDI